MPSDPLFSNNDMDEFDRKMAGILQGSIAMMFRQLIEPVDSISSKHDIEPSTTPSSAPPLKLHDFGGSDFIRLAEKSRRNRRSGPTLTEGTTRKQKMPGHDSSLNNERKCIQECVVRSDGSEQAVYQNTQDVLATESLHHVLYPDYTSNYNRKSVIPTSPSNASSLSSMDDSPLKKLWCRIFD